MASYGRYHRYQTISHSAARELLWSYRLNGSGRMFKVAFRRRTDSRDGNRMAGQQEVMQVRFNVTKHLVHQPNDNAKQDGWVPGTKPLHAAYDRASKNVFCAYVVWRKGDRSVGYRSIPFDLLTWLQIDGTVYKVGCAPQPQH